MKAKEEALAEALHRDEVLRRKLQEEQVSKFQDVGYRVDFSTCRADMSTVFYVFIKVLCKILYDALDATLSVSVAATLRKITYFMLLYDFGN